MSLVNINRKIKIWLPSLIIFVFALILRTFWLYIFPNGITNDELHFVLNAKSVFYQFSDMRGNWNPLSFTTIPQEASSEFPFLLLAPILGPLPTTLFAARFPFALIGSLCALLLYLITKKLINSRTAIFVGLVAAINPWAIYVSRTSFDAPLALFFFILSFYLLINLKKWRILFVFIPLALGFYSYIGTKVIFLPLVIIYLLYSYICLNKKKYLYPYLFVFFLSLLLIVNYYRQLSLGPSRMGELINPNSSSVAAQVETDRRLTLDNPFKQLFTNKYSVVFRNSLVKYLNNFSPKVLFLNGDDTFYVSLWEHGYFYYLDIIFIIFGFLYLYRYHQSFLVFLISCILISPLPEAIRSDKIPAYAFHSALQYPFFYIILGVGIYAFITFISKYKHVRLINAGVITFYVLSLANFFYVYFFRYPIYQADAFNFTHRQLAHYLKLSQSDSSTIYVLSSDPEIQLRNYLFYTNTYTLSTASQIKSIYQSKGNRDFNFNNLIFTSRPQDYQFIPTDVVIIQDGFDLPPNLSQSSILSIVNLSSGQPQYRIYQNHLCKSYSLPTSFKLSDFNLESLATTDFCSLYLRPQN